MIAPIETARPAQSHRQSTKLGALAIARYAVRERREERREERTETTIASGDVLRVLLDTLEHGLAFHSRAGRILHANGSFLRAVENGHDGAHLQDGIAAFARHVWGIANARRLADRVVHLETGRVRTAAGEYRLRGSYVGLGLFGESASVLVSVRLPEADPTSEQRLRERFGLTRKQCVVARLLVQGLRNDEIARRLCISTHTARHHTEQIKLKLAVESRAGIAARVLAAE